MISTFQIWSEALGWTIVHSLWQVTLIAFVLRIVLLLIAQRASRLRYGLALGAMCVAVVWSGFTFCEELSLRADVAQVLTALPQLDTIQLTEQIVVDNELTWWQSLEQHIPTLSLLWLIGIVLFAAHTLHAWWQLRQLQQQHSHAAPSEWQTKLSVWQQQLGMTRPVRLLCSERVSEPITFRHLRPVIIVPISLLTALPAQQVEILLLHELAHIRRYDYLVNWGQSILEVLLFYHPAIWWMSRQVRTEREHCCDDWVMRIHHEPMVYAQALTQLQLSHYSLKTNLAMSATKNQGSFTTRIHRLFGKYPSVAFDRKGAFVALILFAFCIGWTAFPSQAAVEEGTNSAVILNDTIPAEQNNSFPLMVKVYPDGKKVTVYVDNSDGNLDPSIMQVDTFHLHEEEQKGVKYHIQGNYDEDGNWHTYMKDGKKFLVPLDEIENKSITYHIKGKRNEDGNWEYNGSDAENQKTITFLEESGINNLIERVDGQKLEVHLIKDINEEVDTVVTIHPQNYKSKLTIRKATDEEKSKIHTVYAQRTQTDTIVTFDPETMEEEVRVVNTHWDEDIEEEEDVQVEVFSGKKVTINGQVKTDSNQPLMVIDGEIVEIGQSSKLDPENIEKVNVLKDESAIAKYGEAGKNGVVEITTKSKQKLEKNDKFSIDDPIIVLNGKVTDVDVEEISPSDIKAIYIWKGDQAIKRYGEAGRNGVIEITTKREKWKRRKKGEEPLDLSFPPPAPPAPPSAPPASPAPDALTPPDAPTPPPPPPAPPVDFDVEDVISNGAIGNFDGSFRVYPNPASELVNIQVRTKNSAEVRVYVFDAVGRLVYSKYMEQWQGRARFEWDTKEVANGRYTVVVDLDGVRRSEQIIVEN
ncbi:MAG: M56 family metallopeptidase [Bacteroidota bacterium]